MEYATRRDPRDGEPCELGAACLAHVTHPCERCGRIAGQRGRPPAVTFVEYAIYTEAHPGEERPFQDPDVRCHSCMWATRNDTGERVLLWKAGRDHWLVSRVSPDFARHRAELAAPVEVELPGHLLVERQSA